MTLFDRSLSQTVLLFYISDISSCCVDSSRNLWYQKAHGRTMPNAKSLERLFVPSRRQKRRLLIQIVIIIKLTKLLSAFRNIVLKYPERLAVFYCIIVASDIIGNYVEGLLHDE